MSKIIVIDDIQISADKRALHATNTVDALVLLESVIPNGETIDELWLDYDMTSNHGIGADTTLPLAEWLIVNQQSRTPLVIRNVYVHSRNDRAKTLVELLSPYFDVCRATLPNALWWQPLDLPQPTQEEAAMTLTQEATTEEVLHRCNVKEDGSFSIFTYSDEFWKVPTMLPITSDDFPTIKFCPFCGKCLGEPSMASKITQDFIDSALKYCISKRTEHTTQGYIDKMREVAQSLGTRVQVTVIE